MMKYLWIYLEVNFMKGKNYEQCQSREIKEETCTRKAVLYDTIEAIKENLKMV